MDYRFLTSQIRDSIYEKKVFCKEARNNPFREFLWLQIMERYGYTLTVVEKRYILYVLYLLIHSIAIQNDVLFVKNWCGVTEIGIEEPRKQLERIKNIVENREESVLLKSLDTPEFLSLISPFYEAYDRALRYGIHFSSILEGVEDVSHYPYILEKLKELHPCFAVEVLELEAKKEEFRGNAKH